MGPGLPGGLAHDKTKLFSTNQRCARAFWCTRHVYNIMASSDDVMMSLKGRSAQELWQWKLGLFYSIHLSKRSGGWWLVLGAF